jgi:hypothetical protein
MREALTPAETSGLSGERRSELPRRATSGVTRATLLRRFARCARTFCCAAL